jgi:DNA-binding transcriptional MerR regulator
MRIGELARGTGVSRETIHFYLREGLLPPPRKVGRNMAWYDDTHVETLALIKRLQQDKYLPLSVIRRLLKGGRWRASVRDLELAAEVFRSSSDGPGERALRPRGRKAFQRAAGLDEAQVLELEADGLVAPIEAGTGPPEYGPHDLAAAEVLKGLVEAGLTSDEARAHLKLCDRHVRGLVSEESRHFLGLLMRRDPGDAVQAIRATRDLIGGFLSMARERAILEAVEDFVAQVGESTSGETRAPRGLLSAEALAESRAEDVLAELHAAADRDPGVPSRLALTSFLSRLGRADRLVEVTSDEEADPRMAAHRGHALAATGRAGEGQSLLAAAAKARPDDTLIRALHGRVLLVLARQSVQDSKASGNPMELVARAFIELVRSESCQHEGDLDDRLWAMLVRGRLRAAVPTFFGQRGAAKRDLAGVLAALEEAGGAADPTRLRLLTLAAYTLGVLLSEEGESSAEAFQRVIDADPTGELAALALARS